MTIETHGMEFRVDASGVEKGFRDYEAAVDGIFNSLDRFEKKVASTMKSIESAVSNRAALSGFKKSLEGFSNINIDTKAAGKLSALSAAMAGFKAPSATQAANTRKFFTSFQNLPDLSSAFRTIKNLDTLKASLAGFKAPPMSQAENLKRFAMVVAEAAPAFRSLQRISGVSGVANELASISIAMRGLKVPSASQISNLGNFALALQHLGRVNTGETGQMMHALAGINGFKAPTQSNIRNLVSFANALHEIRPIPNAPLIAEQMMMIASAATRANIALGGFRGNLGGFNPAYGRFNAGTRAAKIEMMGLQNAFSATFQVGSILRSLLGSLTVAELGRGLFQAINAANQFTASMEVLGETPVMTGQAWERLRADANHFGADLNHLTDNFSKFALAAHENGVSLAETFKVYEGFQTVMTATHMGTEQQQSVGLAIREMMDQGYVSTQRLTRQLGLVLPGATKTLMEAWKATGSKLTLWDALKKKLVDSTWALDVLSRHYKEEFGPGVVQALKSPIQQFNILKNNIMDMLIQIGDAGAKKAFADLIAQISGYMDPGKVHTFAQSIGIALAGAVNKASEALKFLHDHWDSIVVPMAHVLKLVAEWEIAMGGLHIAKFMVSPFMQMTRVIPLIKTVSATIGVMGASSLPLAAAGAAKLEGRAAGVATSFLNVRKAATVATAALSLEMVATEGLTAKTLLLARASGTTLVAGLRGLVNLVGGPYIATIAAAGYALYELYNAQNAAGEAIQDSNKFLEDSKKTVEEATSKIYLHSTALQTATKSGIDFNDCTRQGAGYFDTYKLHMDKVTGGLYSQAAAARAATIETLKLQAAQNQGKLATLQTHSTKELGGLASQQFSQGHYGEYALTQLYRGAQGLSSHLPFGTSQDDINGQIAKIRENGANIQKALTDAQNTNVMDIVKQMQAAGLGAPDKTDAIYHGSEGGGKGHHKKGPNPYTEINHVENAIDDLMKRLSAEDPIGKLYNDFTKNITKESKDLLTAGGHKEWLAAVAKAGGSAEVQTQALITMLNSGIGISKKQLDDLQKRYGKGVPEIVQLLKKQLDDLHQHEVEAIAKTIEGENRAVMKARDALGDFDPLTKIQTDAVQKLKPLAEQLFAGNKDAFAKWYQPLTDGSKSATQGIRELQAAMNAAADPTSAMAQNLLMMGTTGEDLQKIMDGLAQSIAYQTAQAQESLIVGGKLLRQKHEEVMLLGLSANQAEIMKDLQQEVNERLQAGLPISAKEISQLKEKLTAQKALADQMQRNKDFFENNGVRSYINDLKDVGSAVNDLDKNFLQSLEDQLYSLGTTGKFSFKAIFDTIQQGIVRMAAQGLTQNFTQMIFGKQALENGQPSFFGSTIGKMFGGYQAKQTAPLGTMGEPLWVKLAGGPGFDALTVNSKTGNLQSGPERLGQVLVGGQPADAGLASLKTVGTNPMTPMYVRDADRALTGGLPGLTGGTTGLGPSAFPINADGTDPLAPLGGSGSSGTVPGAVGGPGNSPAAAAGATVANSFKQNMASVIPMIGMMFASKFKSPIAQIGAMFLTMMLTKMMTAQAGSAAGGGGGGGIGGLISALFSGGGGAAPVPAAREGGIVGAFVSNQMISPAAFRNAPHYNEGTANTSGIPAMLHDNEAVIPLSRGRKVPVELTGGSGRGNGTTVINNFNVSSPDADSFKKSKQQVATDLHVAATRAFRRNNP